MAKKNELLNTVRSATQRFLDTVKPEEGQEAIQKDAQEETMPAPEPTTQAPIRETKSRRLQLLVRPSTYKALAKEARKKRKSVNEIANRIFEEYLKEAQK